MCVCVCWGGGGLARSSRDEHLGILSQMYWCYQVDL